MVFESVVADALLLYLGDYVKNLSGEQLKISVFSGSYCLVYLYIIGQSIFSSETNFSNEKYVYLVLQNFIFTICYRKCSAKQLRTKRGSPACI
jgi:hypothetical protein